ncbi:hypothetical protein ACOME3_002110 [Neoechinorhynchus agilis]
MGNECRNRMVDYRRRLISDIKNLRFLDGYPVSKSERRITEAWCNGGTEAESEMRKLINLETEEEQRRMVEYIMNLQEGRDFL